MNNADFIITSTYQEIAGTYVLTIFMLLDSLCHQFCQYHRPVSIEGLSVIDMKP